MSFPPTSRDCVAKNHKYNKTLKQSTFCCQPDICLNEKSERLIFCVWVAGKAKRGTLSELTGSMSRAAGKTINQIITFSKRKPPLLGARRDDDPGCGEAPCRLGPRAWPADLGAKLAP